MKNSYEYELQVYGDPKKKAELLLNAPIHTGKKATKEDRINWINRLINENNSMIKSIEYWKEVIKEIEIY